MKIHIYRLRLLSCIPESIDGFLQYDGVHVGAVLFTRREHRVIFSSRT